MAWSTRQLAEIAGTTVKTVRHYHAIGLLDEPARAPNGYKQYGTDHLVHLVQIKRLRDLGLSSAEIRQTTNSRDDFLDAVRALDARLASSIKRQRQIRAELSDLLAYRTGPDIPAGFESIAESLTDADRAVISISPLLYDEQRMQDLRAIAEDHQEADAAFNELPPDADAHAVRDVVERLAPVLRTIHKEYPESQTLPRTTRARDYETTRALHRALTDLYNPAQIEVLQQAYRLARKQSFNETGG